MSKRGNRQPIPGAGAGKPQVAHTATFVPSLYDRIQVGREYGSIVDLMPAPGTDVLRDVQRSISDIQSIRGRPCIAYVGNVVRADGGGSGIDQSDDLPFMEMIKHVPADQREVDVFLATRGGSGQQVVRFVEHLRNRFDRVEFIVPSFCMSAGTLFALSGDRIWMTPTASLGPTDPQILGASGFVPAQAMLTLVEQVRVQGEEAIAAGKPIPWTAVQIINGIHKADLGNAITATKYSERMAAQFLERYKFKDWTTRESSGMPVTPEYRSARAKEVAQALASHDRWNSHGHSISREVLWREIKLKIDLPSDDLLTVITKAWALYNWLFEKTNLVKLMISENYRFARSENIPVPNGKH